MDCSLPGSSVHGILLARTLEWIAIPSSRDSTCLKTKIMASGPITQQLKSNYNPINVQSIRLVYVIILFIKTWGKFLSSSVVRTPCFHCQAWVQTLTRELRSHEQHGRDPPPQKKEACRFLFQLTIARIVLHT